MPTKQPKSFAHFNFDIADAVLSRLIATFDALPVGPLTAKMLSQIDPGQGIYMIYHSDKIMYVGSTADNLSERLGEHLKEITKRKDINITDVGFKCAIVPKNWMSHIDLKAFTAEYHWQWLGEQRERKSRTGRRNSANSR